MSAENNIIYDNYKKLTEDEKLEFIIKDMQYVCSGCGQNCCFTCMYNTINNTKLRGWYCCRNIECQKMYDDDESV